MRTFVMRFSTCHEHTIIPETARDCLSDSASRRRARDVRYHLSTQRYVTQNITTGFRGCLGEIMFIIFINDLVSALRYTPAFMTRRSSYYLMSFSGEIPQVQTGMLQTSVLHN